MSDWQGLNLGIPGATTFEALDSMVPDAITHNPSASVVCLDLNSSLIGYIPRANASRRSDIVSNLIRSFNTWMMIEGAYHSLFSERVQIIPVEEYGQQLDQVFERLSQSGVTQHVLLVGYTPLKDYPNLYTQEIYNQYREKSREIARKRNIPIIEFTDALRGLSTEQAYVGEHKIHLSAQGHRRIASAVINILNGAR
jgi:lysophospholipase L1-like esterase